MHMSVLANRIFEVYKTSPEHLVGGSGLLMTCTHRLFAFAKARPLSLSGFFTPIPSGLHTLEMSLNGLACRSTPANHAPDCAPTELLSGISESLWASGETNHREKVNGRLKAYLVPVADTQGQYGEG